MTNEGTTPTISNAKTYGSAQATTNNATAPKRNERSVGGTSATTNESEPLLGERLLARERDVRSADGESPEPFRADASTVEHDASTAEREPEPFRADASAATRDPRIGISVFASDSDANTLSYSRDLDDSTLGDRYFRGGSKKGSAGRFDDVEEGEGRGGSGTGPLRGVLSGGGGGGQVYFLVCFGLAAGIALCAAAALAYVEYWHHYGVDVLPDPAGNGTGAGGGGGGGATASSDGSWRGVPFERIGRDSFGDSVSSVLDADLFHPSLLYRENVERASQGEGAAQPFFKFPFPTGAFWTNLVLLPVTSSNKQQQQQQQAGRRASSKDKNQYSYPIVAYPYSFQWSPLGKLQASYSAARRTVQSDSIQDAFAPDITFGSVEDTSARHVTEFDSLSVSLRFYSGGGISDGAASGYWESHIVQGSPYVTARYYGLTPELSAPSDFEDIACPPVMDQLKVKTDGQFVRTPSPSTDSTKRRTTSAASATGTDTAKMLGICDVSDDSTQRDKFITGVQFVVTTKEGLTWLVFASEPITFEFRQDARHAIASKDLFGGVIRVALVPPASSRDGSAVSNAFDVNYLASSPGVKRLIYHADAYPVGGSVNWDFRSGTRNPLAAAIATPSGHRKLVGSDTSSPNNENNIGTITFKFDTEHMTKSSPNSKVSLLMLALPHHAAAISSAEEMLLQSTEFELIYRSIKGRMTPIVGNSWSYEEELTTIGFGDEPIAKPTQTSTTTSSVRHQTTSEFTAIAALDQSVRDIILETVIADLKLNLPDTTNGAYGFGKQVARLAQLAHIADRLETENGATSSNLKNSTRRASASSSSGGHARRAYALLEMYLTMWLTGDDGSGRLVYDANLGGILSKEGIKDVFSDFGNARYNDHHFHYGYLLYAAAILGKKNPQFITQYGSYIDAVFYDVAHNSNSVIRNGKKDDALFPLARHKSWFDGHSFASGLFPFADGKSQESSSEATNCYYGAYLWSKVRWGSSADGGKLVNFARLLLATELTGAKTYWHMVPPVESGTETGGSRRLLNNNTRSLVSWQPPAAYNSVFEKNYMVGNLGMTDVNCRTWFGTENVYVHLINFMPVTAITSELFDKAYVKEERKALSDGVSVDNSWKGYAICHEAILDPNKAWTDAQSVISSQLDPGLSKSQVLYWISTREGFLPSTTAVTSGNAVSLDNDDSDNDATIPQTASFSSTSQKSVSDSDDSSCESHESCAAMNLSGQCCPTNEDVMLSCCT